MIYEIYIEFETKATGFKRLWEFITEHCKITPRRDERENKGKTSGSGPEIGAPDTRTLSKDGQPSQTETCGRD